MTEEQSNAVENNYALYRKELFVVVASSVFIMLIGMGVLFMLPFPGLLDVTIWGYPFPFWYQMTIAYIGVIVFIYWIVTVLAKIDTEKGKAKAEREVS